VNTVPAAAAAVGVLLQHTPDGFALSQSAIVGMVISKTELLKEEVVDIDVLHDRYRPSLECTHTAQHCQIRYRDVTLSSLCVAA